MLNGKWKIENENLAMGKVTSLCPPPNWQNPCDALSAWLSRINAIFMLMQSIGLIESNVLTTQRPQMERFGACPRFSLLSSVPTNKLSGAQQQQVRNMHKTLYGI